MIWISSAAGLALGILHWWMFYLPLRMLVTQKESTISHRIFYLFSCLRLIVTIGLGVLAIRVGRLNALALAIGLFLGFNTMRLFLFRASRKKLEE
ncbi:hypothetical protein IJT17_04875 [bacterium]|nr:hypothetical protein [bacterium]